MCLAFDIITADQHMFQNVTKRSLEVPGGQSSHVMLTYWTRKRTVGYPLCTSGRQKAITSDDSNLEASYIVFNVKNVAPHSLQSYSGLYFNIQDQGHNYTALDHVPRLDLAKSWADKAMVTRAA